MKIETRRQIRNRSKIPLDTDAWAFLNISNPICAWATYRASLLTAPKFGGHISIWYASVLKKEGKRLFEIELSLEKCRSYFFADHVSRLRGMFCFRDLASAESALQWGGHFRADYLAELSTYYAKRASGPYDANWISFAALEDSEVSFPEDWPHRYWKGERSPFAEPIWETLIEGELMVLGTALRERAYSVIKSHFPDSLMFLELGRQAAWVGSRLTNVSAYLFKAGENELECIYLMDMRDANNHSFLQRLGRLAEEGHPINRADMKPHIENDSFGRTMDLSRMHFRFEGQNLPFDLSYSLTSGIASGRLASYHSAETIDECATSTQ